MTWGIPKLNSAIFLISTTFPRSIPIREPNPMQTNPTPNTARKATITDALYEYMVDCHFGTSHLNAMCLSLAIEYAYQPQLRFWRDFKIEDLLAAVTRLLPDWDAGLDAQVKVRMLEDVAEILRMNAFDEANAERLLALPAEERPTDAESAFTWIFRDLKRNGRLDELAYARRDGNKCGRHALDMARIISADEKWHPKIRTGTLVAAAYRDAALKCRSAHHG